MLQQFNNLDELFNRLSSGGAIFERTDNHGNGVDL